MQFSVVMPVHNRAALVGAAIESVLSQPDWNDCELLVVDDGSTDSTLQVLASFGEAIRVFEQPNAGPGAARNRGIAAAKGRYVTFLDSDDLWLPWTLATYRREVEGAAPPSLLIAQSKSFEREDELQSLRPENVRVERLSDYLSSSRRALWFGASSLVVRADVLRGVGGFAPQWINAEDLDLCLKLGASPGLSLLQAPATFGYRKHPGSAVSNLSRTLAGVRHLIAQERLGRYPGGAARKRERLEILTRHVRPVALECLKRGHKRDGWDLYRQTFAWHAHLKRAKFLAAFPARALLSREEKTKANNQQQLKTNK